MNDQITKPSKMVTVKPTQSQEIAKKSKTVAEVNNVKHVTNEDKFTDKCHHGISTESVCDICILDNAPPPQDPQEAVKESRQNKQAVDDVFGEDEVVEEKPSEDMLVINQETILSNILKQQIELGLQAKVQYDFQDTLIDKYNNLNGAKTNSSYRNSGASHQMNGLIENIQRGFTEGLAFRKEQTKINMDLLKVLESFKDEDSEKDTNALLAKVLESMKS